jgi:hypothetical protein
MMMDILLLLLQASPLERDHTTNNLQRLQIQMHPPNSLGDWSSMRTKIDTLLTRDGCCKL